MPSYDGATIAQIQTQLFQQQQQLQSLADVFNSNQIPLLQLLSPQSLFMDYGVAGQIASGGAITVAHRLGRVPQIVLTGNQWSDGTSSAFFTASALTASQFTVTNKGTTTGQACWVAIG